MRLTYVAPDWDHNENVIRPYDTVYAVDQVGEKEPQGYCDCGDCACSPVPRQWQENKDSRDERHDWEFRVRYHVSRRTRIWEGRQLAFERYILAQNNMVHSSTNKGMKFNCRQTDAEASQKERKARGTIGV